MLHKINKLRTKLYYIGVFGCLVIFWTYLYLYKYVYRVMLKLLLRLGSHSANKSYSKQKGLFFKMDYVCKFPQGEDQGLFQQHAIGLQK